MKGPLSMVYFTGLSGEQAAELSKGKESVAFRTSIWSLSVLDRQGEQNASN